MKVGVIGLGKLGLPVALAIDAKGHDVIGYDINPTVSQYLADKKVPFREEGLQPLLDNNNLKLANNIEEVVQDSDVIFLAIQTPHDPRFEGTTRLPVEREDFNYDYLTEGIAEVAKWALYHEKCVNLVVISTCLPGTYKERIAPLLNKFVNYIYNPFFIAMGTVLRDFYNPEFVLLGTDSYEDSRHAQIITLYRTIHNKQSLWTDITTAEAIKVSYNTFITMKTVLANTWGEIAQKVGANADDIYLAWSMATDRLMSPKYLKAGMGDGGGCHPRDNIALSWLAKKIDLSHNLFEDLMLSREQHAEWIGTLVGDTSLPIIILGRAFKPETDIETGSPAILMAHILREKGHTVLHVEDANTDQRAVYIIGTQNERYKDIKFKEGSRVIDPFGYIQDQHGVEVHRIGRR